MDQQVRCNWHDKGSDLIIELRYPTHYFKTMPDTDDFAQEYRGWLAGKTPRLDVGEKRTNPGSVSGLIVRYYHSAEFVSLAQSMQRTYRGILERFRADHGHRLVRQLERKHVRAIH